MTKRKILIPLDRTNYSLKILPEIEKLIAPSETEIVLLHVAKSADKVGVTVPTYEADMPVNHHPDYTMANQWPHMAYAGKDEATIQQRLEEQLRSKSLPLKQAGYQVSTLVAFGDPAKEIMKAISDEHIDLIAMTTHARAGLKKLFVGSVTEEILHHTAVPMLVLHPTEAE